MLAFGGALSPLLWLFIVLGAAAFVVEAWAFGDALMRPGPAFPAVGKQTKPLWLIILGVASVIGLGSLISSLAGGALSLIGILPVAAFVAAAIYMTDVRPKVKDFRPGSRQGPYGPW